MILPDIPGHKELVDLVQYNNQAHVFRFWDELDETQRSELISQLEKIDFRIVNKLVDTYVKSAGSSESDSDKEFSPPDVVSIPQTEDDFRNYEMAKTLGEKYLTNGKVAVFMVAGGQGSRLGYEGPKGCYKISPVKNKTIFQLHCEKILAMQKIYDNVFPLYIMTSETNHEETVTFFKDNDYFGLTEVHFFKQGMLPAVDEDGRLILSDKHRIFMNPDGHGGSIYALNTSGAIDQMKEKGVELIFYMQVDNILINMLDPFFIGKHILEGAEMSSKAVKKSSPQEKVGVIGLVDGKTSVIEYSILPDKLRYERDSAGNLKYNAGNIAIHCLNVDFVERVYAEKLPYNKAFKAIPFLDDEGNFVKPDSPNAYKFEMFVFDALSMAKKTMTMLVDREKEFAPVKNKEGNDSPRTAKEMMSNFYKSWLIYSGLDVANDSVIEVSPLFALDKKEFKRKTMLSPPVVSGSEIYIE